MQMPPDMPAIGSLTLISEGVVRITANNPSPMTGSGTNSYIIGDTRVVIVDPGPGDPAHLHALISATRGRPVDAIILTHSHVDHSTLAPDLARATGAPVLAFGDATAGRSAFMREMVGRGLAGPGEGIDSRFAPDAILADGGTFRWDGVELTALHTPGHMANHLCLEFGDVLLTGDHVMGWSTSIVAPPDGDMTAYMDSLHRLRDGAWRIALPGHGATISDPATRIAELIRHRHAREALVLSALSTEPETLSGITRRAYPDLPVALLPMAEQNCRAHLLDLLQRGLVRSEHPHARDARFASASAG